MKIIAIAALLVLLGVTDAAAQAIPVDIPDTPGESPADREREKHKERHHAALSRFFGTTSVSASPFVTGGGLFLDTVFEGGIETGRGDAVFLMLGARSTQASAKTGTIADQIEGGGQLFALGYEVGLARFSSHPIVGGSSVSVAVGGFLGEVDLLYVDVSPRYIVRANSYWSFPIGLKLTTGLVSEHADAVGSVGFTAGVRRHFGQRETLE